MSFPPYKKYHESGLDWMGPVPSHWSPTRFKQIFREREERSPNGDEELLSVSAYTGVSPRASIVEDGDHLSRAETLEGYKKCYTDDLVMNIMLAWNRGLGFAAQDGIVSPAYCVFRIVDGSSPRFLDYLLRSNECIGYFRQFSAGVIDSRLRLYPDVFLSLRCALPPIVEQIAIADFLDRETSKIGALVGEQKHLIDLLKEKRQAVISRALTVGPGGAASLDINGRTQLENSPANWDEVAIKRALALVTSGPRGWSDLLGAEGDFFFQSQNIGARMEAVYADIKRVSAPSDAESDRAVAHEKDVAICITGGRTGAVAYVESLPGTTYVNQHVAILRTDPEIMHGKFLAYALVSDAGRGQLSAATYGLKQGLALDQVRNLRLARPPLPIQEQVVKYLDGRVGELDNLIDETELAIGLLEERRAALISAAAAGKIDVRRFAASAEDQAA